MSKRGAIESYFTRLPTDNKKVKAGHERQGADTDKSVSHNDQQQQQQPLDQHLSSGMSGNEGLGEAGDAGGSAPQRPNLQQQAKLADPTAQVATSSRNAFGALMAAAKPDRSTRSAADTPASSPENKLGVQALQDLAIRNQTCAVTVVQDSAAKQQQVQLRQLLVEHSWLRVLTPEFDKPYMKALQAFLEQEWSTHVIYPPKESIFRTFNAVPFDQVRVVILGQDPYINQGEAMGLSFSVPPGVRVPPSLANMYKELVQDVGAYVPKHGCLQKWCSQGVLLLNAALTVRAKSSNSHAGKGWESFTSAALTALAKQRSGIVFMLWGKYAQDRCAKLDMKKHFVLKSVHPSPLSAHRGFLGCRHFSAANELLQQAGHPPIDWQIEDI